MSTSTPVARQSRRQRKPRSDIKLGLAFILPATIGLVAFYIWPLFRGIWLSFTEYNLLTPEEFTGLDNYKRMAQDDTFWNAVVVTVEYVVINIGLQTVLALLIAVLMQRLTQSTFVRSIVLTPYLVSNVVAAMLWLWILDNTLGVTNQLLESLTGSKTDFFSSSLAIPTIAIINVWRHVGYTALLIFAGLQSIPSTVYEAGKMDGASEWRMFWRITVPPAAPDPGPGAHHDDDRLLLGLRHRLGGHPGRPRQRHPRAAVLHLRHGLRALPVRVRLRHGGGSAARPGGDHDPAVPHDPCGRDGPGLKEDHP